MCTFSSERIRITAHVLRKGAARQFQGEEVHLYEGHVP
jgi:hypothetical protein